MKISVAMATYNGEKYIKEQIESIFNQTYPIDELIISDDGSTDSTIEIVKSFNDDRIKIFDNSSNNMGYAGNFENSLRKTSGDIIFLCDQDDIWVKNKVELTIKAFDSNPNVHLIVSDAFLMDGHGNKIDEPFYHPLSGDSHFVSIDGYRDYPPFYTLKIYGMTMCFKKTLLHEAIPFPKSTTSHDRWITFCAMTLHNGFYYLSDKLVYYRIHGSNASMSSETSARKKFAKICRVIYNTPYDMTNISTKMMHILEKTNLADTKAYSETNDILYNYKQQAKAYESSIFKGISIILNLKKSNKWYAIDGSKYFLAQIYIIIFGRRYMKKNKRELCD